MKAIVCGVVFLILVSVLFIKVYAEISFGERKINLAIKLLFFKKNIDLGSKKAAREPLAENAEKRRERFSKETTALGDKIAKYKQVYKTATRFSKKYVYMEKIDVSILVGTGDAASTAVSTGALWAAVFGLIKIISTVMRISKPKVNVAPNYQNAVFNCEGDCIISARLGNIIIIATAILLTLRRNKK